MKLTYIGFNGPQPYAIILWLGNDKEPKSKTICYSKQEVEKSLARHTTPGDFYNGFTPSIHYTNDSLCEKVS